MNTSTTIRGSYGALVALGLLVMHRSMTCASRQERLQEPRTNVASRQEMADLIWGKYGALLGTGMALGIMGTLWTKSLMRLVGREQEDPARVKLAATQERRREVVAAQKLLLQHNVLAIIQALDLLYSMYSEWGVRPFHTIIPPEVGGGLELLQDKAAAIVNRTEREMREQLLQQYQYVKKPVIEEMNESIKETILLLIGALCEVAGCDMSQLQGQ